MDHGAPQRFHTRTRLLPVLVPTPRPAAGPGARSRATLDYRGILPVRQGPSRTRRTPSTHLDLVAPLGDPVHARHGLPGRHLRQRTRRHTHPARPDSVHPQRDSAPLRQTRPRPHCHRRQHLGLVTLATKTPGHRTLPSLSAQVRTPMNPIYNCSTRRNDHQLGIIRASAYSRHRALVILSTRIRAKMRGLTASACPCDSSRKHASGLSNEHTTDDPPPWLHPHRAQQGLHSYYEPVRQRVPQRYSLPRGSAAWQAPSRPPPLSERQCRDTPSHVPCTSSRPDSRRLHAGHRLARNTDTRQTPPGPTYYTPVLMPPDWVTTRPQRSPKTGTAHRLPGPHLTHLVRLFHIAHHDGLQPTQHVVVCSLPPHGRLRRARPSSPAQHRVQKLYLQMELPSTFVAHVGSQFTCHLTIP